MKRIRRVVKKAAQPLAADADCARVGAGTSTGADPGSLGLRTCNPMVRLCESLLPWKVLTEVGSQRTTKNTPAAHGLDPLPILYKSVEEYVMRWESAVILELKASILSNISAQTFESTRMIEISDVKNSDQPHSSLVKLSYRLVRSQEDR